jgi:type IV pilus assembly protein PilM
MVMPLLESITEMLIMEVQKTFEFFRETYPNETIARVLICGGTSRTPGLAEKLQETLGYPTEVLNPLKHITIGPKVKRGANQFAGSIAHRCSGPGFEGV